MSIDLDIIFKIRSIHYVSVAIILKQQHPSLPTSLISLLLDEPTWTILEYQWADFISKRSSGNSNCLYTNSTYNLIINGVILNSTIEYLISTERLKCFFSTKMLFFPFFCVFSYMNSSSLFFVFFFFLSFLLSYYNKLCTWWMLYLS